MPPEAPPYRVLIAFDKLKDALSAEEACAIAVRVLSRLHPHWLLDVAPLSDGGEGFCRITTEALRGTLQEVDVHGPRLVQGQLPAMRAPLGVVDVADVPPAALARLALPEGARRLALIDMAAANGLGLVPASERDVWQSSTRGTGELLLAADRLGVDAIVLGIGGSATSDLGLGALTALGLRCEDAAGHPLAPIVPALWTRLARVRGSLRKLPALRVACDVDNPLLGSRGAASVYGPQKGLSPADLPRFEAEAERVCTMMCDALGVEPALRQTPGAGAAGGLGFGLMAAGAELVPGFALISSLLQLDARLARADWVITGEGRYDASSLAGKGPHALALAAAAHARRCTVFAGSISLEARVDSGPELIAISPPELSLELALSRTAAHLELAIERAAAGARH